jgi:histidinol dehydrogenase
LGVDDFVKRSSVLCFSPEALAGLAPDVSRLARMEGFDAHAHAVDVRVSPRSGGEKTGN